MNSYQDKVRDFHLKIGQPVSPAQPELRDVDLRARLIAEEAIETVVALVGRDKALKIIDEKIMDSYVDNGEPSFAVKEPNLIEAIDGLCDLVYTVMGTAEAIGIDLEPFYNSVHESNMAKVGAPLDSAGKITKPAGWKPPQIKELLENSR